MENKNICYIDYLDSYLEVMNERFPKWFRKIIYWFLNYFGVVRKNENVFCLMTVENGKINEKMINNLYKNLIKFKVKNLVFADAFYNREKFTELFEKDFNILNGKWLYKFLIFDIIKKIAIIQNKKLSDYEITILCNKSSEIVVDNIKMLSKKCKILNVLTKKVSEFSHIEEELYEQFGILLTVSSNFSKTCLHSELIVNVDFSNSDLEKCEFKDKNILIQCTKEKFDNRKGIVITYYRFDLLRKYLGFWGKLSHFEIESLYESLLYYNVSFLGIRKLLKRDKVKIKYLEGLHGRLDFREFKEINT